MPVTFTLKVTREYLPRLVPLCNHLDGQGLDHVRGKELRVVDNNSQDANEDIEKIDFNVVSLFNGKLAQALEAIPSHFAAMSEQELIDTVEPNDLDWQLRLNFWEKVKEARKLGTTITTVSVYDGIITKQTFFESIMPHPGRMAFIARPVIDHAKLYEAINRLALKKLFQMVQQMPIDAKYFPQLLRVAEAAGNRAYGAVAQKMQIHSKNLNVEVDAKQLPPVEGQEDLNKRIEQMQAKLLEGPKDVTNTSKE